MSSFQFIKVGKSDLGILRLPLIKIQLMGNLFQASLHSLDAARLCQKSYGSRIHAFFFKLILNMCRTKYNFGNTVIADSARIDDTASLHSIEDRHLHILSQKRERLAQCFGCTSTPRQTYHPNKVVQTPCLGFDRCLPIFYNIDVFESKTNEYTLEYFLVDRIIFSN